MIDKILKFNNTIRRPVNILLLKRVKFHGDFEILSFLEKVGFLVFSFCLTTDNLLEIHVLGFVVVKRLCYLEFS